MEVGDIGYMLGFDEELNFGDPTRTSVIHWSRYGQCHVQFSYNQSVT